MGCCFLAYIRRLRKGNLIWRVLFILSLSMSLRRGSRVPNPVQVVVCSLVQVMASTATSAVCCGCSGGRGGLGGPPLLVSRWLPWLPWLLWHPQWPQRPGNHRGIQCLFPLCRAPAAHSHLRKEAQHDSVQSAQILFVFLTCVLLPTWMAPELFSNVTFFVISPV